MSVTGTNWDVTDELSHPTPDDAVTSGDGGGLAPIWSAGRDEKLQQLAAAAFTNESEFSIPAGVVGTGGWDIEFPDEELVHGVSVQATTTDYDNTPLAGTASIETGTGTLVEENVSETFILSAPPPSGVGSGDDVETSTFTFKFLPSTNSVPYEQSNISFRENVGAIYYGAIAGTVTDYNGDPVEGASVSVPGGGDTTDADGEYEFGAPGGQNYQATALRGSASTTESVTGGQTNTVNFQFAGLRVNVILPDGTGIVGVPVNPDVTDGAGRTSPDGSVLFPEAEVNVTANIDISDGEFTLSTPTPTQGGLGQATKRTGVGVKGRCVSTDGVSAENVDARIVSGDNEVLGTTSGTGRYAVGFDNSGEVTVQIAVDDRRYNRFDRTVTVSDGTVEDGEDFTLGERTNTGTY